MRIYRIGFLGERTKPGRIGSQFSLTGRRYSHDDLDLEKFFDRINHDMLMGLVSGRVEDKRIRALAWRQWKRGRTRYKALRCLGVGKDLAAQAAGSPHGSWRISMSLALSIALPNASLAKLGLAPCGPIQ